MGWSISRKWNRKSRLERNWKWSRITLYKMVVYMVYIIVFYQEATREGSSIEKAFESNQGRRGSRGTH
jgi:hypothetical protein